MNTTVQKNLLKLRNDLLRDIDGNNKQISTSERDVGDFYDDADVEKHRQMINTLGERDRAKLKAIDEALSKIEDGIYGECEECGEDINKKRLNVLPFARYCVKCQSEFEKQLKQHADESIEDKLLYKDVSISDMENID